MNLSLIAILTVSDQAKAVIPHSVRFLLTSQVWFGLLRAIFKVALITSVKAAQYTAKTVSQTAQVTAKTIKLAVPVMKAAAKAAAAGIKAAAKAIAAAVEAMVAGMKALAAVIAAGGWVAVLIIVLVCAAAMMIAFFLNSADSFAQQNGEKLIASDTGWQETGIFQ